MLTSLPAPQVESFGVGRSVKLPGPSKEQPNSYPFGTPYQAIYDDLAAKDSELYARTGLLDMARRNLNIKHAPERWQNCMCALRSPGMDVRSQSGGRVQERTHSP